MKDYGERWNTLTDMESEIEKLEIDVDGNNANPADVGYHRQFYIKYTYKTRILKRGKIILKNGGFYQNYNAADTTPN